MSEQRWVGRVDCEVEGRVRTVDGWIRVRIHDLSRGGVGFSLPPAAIGLAKLEGIGSLARRLANALDEVAEIELSPQSLGRLLTRRLRIVRIHPWNAYNDEIRLGATIEPLLSDAEAEALGLSLPGNDPVPSQSNSKHPA